MRLASWNVNSIRSRQDQLVAWLRLRKLPEIVCLQETKVTDDLFPKELYESMGYHVAFHGQKTYNGVCILSTFPISNVSIGLDNPLVDHEARVISATIEGIRVINVYVPNGQAPGTDKFFWKFQFLPAFITFVQKQVKQYKEVIVCGDINIAHTDLDVWNPSLYTNSIMFTQQEKDAVSKLLSLGLLDVYREKYPDKKEYSWFDYMSAAFDSNRGWRIDYIFATPNIQKRVADIAIDSQPRAQVKPSDHCPVVALLNLKLKIKK